MERTARWDLVAIFTVSLLLRVCVALPMQRPGYMDAAYYVDGALSLYDGRGFNDPFIWNYLDDPAGIPHPSHLYWMPLSSILAYLSFLAFGPTYRAAQVPFALLSSLLPLLSYRVAYDVAQNRRHALCAGLFATFSGFYTAYWVTPDNFAPFALAGALCLWAVGRGLKSEASGGNRAVWFAIAGLGAGFAHLARADGLLLPVVALVVGILQICKSGNQRMGKSGNRRLGKQAVFRSPFSILHSPFATCYLLFATCYLFVVGPWLIRNVSAIDSPLSTAGAQSVWLTSYDDLYSYAEPLTAQSYLAWGWGNILKSKLDALWLNAQTVLFVGWMIFLAPFGLIGVWRLRRRVEFGAAWLYGGLLYLAMSVVFTFPGWRGGMLHSTVALLPFLYAAAMDGLDASINWVARLRRTWQPHQAKTVFSVAFVGFAVALSGTLYGRGLDKFAGKHLYSEVATWMDERVPSTARVMVNDPASFYYHSRRECLSIPNADLETVLEVMDRYGADYLLLNDSYRLLRTLYDSPRSDERLVLLETFVGDEEAVYLFERAGSQAPYE